MLAPNGKPTQIPTMLPYRVFEVGLLTTSSVNSTFIKLLFMIVLWTKFMLTSASFLYILALLH